MALNTADLFRVVTGWTYCATAGNNTPPGAPVVDELDVVGPAGAGAWAGLSNRIVRWDGSTWVTVKNPGPTDEGLRVYSVQTNTVRGWSGVAWSDVLVL